MDSETARNKKENELSLFESVSRNLPKTSPPISDLVKEWKVTLQGIACKYGLSVPDLLEKAETDREYREEYSEIRKDAKREKATIYWVDKKGLYFDYIPDRSFGTRGHTQYIGGTAEHFRCNMLSATTNKKRVYFMARESVVYVKADLFLEFLKRLMRHRQRKVFIITNNHLVKRSRKIKFWLAENVSQIRLISLP